MVVQKYLSNPLLLDGLKFDLRIYVLLVGIAPLRLYIYEDGMARFATQKFQKPNRHNLKNHFIHLTNYAINKTASEYRINSKKGSISYKRSL